MKAFLAKYSGVTHALAVAWAFVMAAYIGSSAFSGAVNAAAVEIYHALPHSLAVIVTMAISILGPLWAFYRNGEKPAADSAPPHPSVAAKALALLLVLGFGCSVLSGCTDWERQTFQTLAASKAVVDQAHADYQARTIPRSAAAYELINEADAAQTLAVQLMDTYETIKAANGTPEALTAQQAIVDAALAKLPALIAAVKALYPAKAPAVTSGQAFDFFFVVPDPPASVPDMRDATGHLWLHADFVRFSTLGVKTA